MKNIYQILINLRNLLPYLLLIATYFFFINLEARNDNDNVRNNDVQNRQPKDILNIDDKNLRIKIPVIPYEQ